MDMQNTISGGGPRHMTWKQRIIVKRTHIERRMKQRIYAWLWHRGGPLKALGGRWHGPSCPNWCAGHSAG